MKQKSTNQQDDVHRYVGTINSKQSDEERKNPLRMAYYFVHYPRKIIMFVAVLLVIVLTVDAFGFEFSQTVTHAYFIKGDPQVHRMNSVALAKQHLTSSSSRLKVKPKTQAINDYTLSVMYKTKDGSNILQPSNIADYIEFIIETNNKIPNTNYDEYYSFCLADTTDPYVTYPDCSSKAVWDPIVTVFGNNYHNITQQAMDTFVDSYLDNSYTVGAFLSSFQEGFEDTRSSQYYRAFYRFGLPYPDINNTMSSFRDATDREEKQSSYYEEWAFPIFQEIQIKQNEHDNVEVVILGGVVREMQRLALTYMGVAFAAGSVVTVFSIMCWHLNSLFLATTGMIQIIAGFPFAFVLYRYVFQVTFFDTLNTLVIFLILGIGADDVFVFVDAWVQSAHFVPMRSDNVQVWLVERMDFAYRRAAKAMIVTTATTFFAFMATATSPIMPISAFGLWAGCVVLLNYCMVISLFPAVLSYWYQNIRPKERCPKCCVCGCCSNSDQSEETEPRCMEKFLSEKWMPWIDKYSIIILPLVFIAFGFAVYKAQSISPLTKQEEWFEEDHYMTKMYGWQTHFDGGSVQSLMDIQMVWGLQDTVDDSDVTYWDVDYLGHVQFDATFNPSTPDAQEHLEYVCDSLLINSSSLLYDATDYFTCWVYDFRTYGESLGLQYPFVWTENDTQAQRESYTRLVLDWTTQTEVGIQYASRGEIGIIDNEFKFAYIEFKIPYAYYSEHKPEVFADLEDIVLQFNEMAPKGVSNAYQTTTMGWAWMITQDGFVTSAVQGIGIAVPLALLCLVLSTQNLIISLYATSAIVGIVACEVALMVLQGWELGISESISVVMIVGFSVDYVVHLGNAYIECPESEIRYDRLKFSLFTMGISVVSGALTTFGSGFWLIFPEFLFFKKFGILVMSVVTFSLFFSMVYFTSCLARCGPQGKTGYVPIIPCIVKMFQPLSKCWCDGCRYICCCCGSMDEFYADNNNQEENDTDKARKATELVIREDRTGS
eukprot:476462_1